MRRKQHPLFILITLVVLVLSLTPVFAQEADTPIRTQITLAKTTFSAPEEVSLTIQIANISSEAIPGLVSLFYPNGNPVTDFGDKGSIQIPVGETALWTGNWTITQEELDAGKIAFSVKYSKYDQNNAFELVAEPIEKEITYEQVTTAPEGEQTAPNTVSDPALPTVQGPSLEFTAHYAVPTIAANKEKIGFYFTIRNNGDVDLENISITNNKTVSSKASVLSELKVGEERTAQISNLEMGKKDIKSVFKATYQAVGSNKKYTATSDEVVIKYGTPQLTAKLEASAKGVNRGETATLTLTLTNSGKKDYVVNTVADADTKNGIGEVFTNITVGAGKTVKETKDVIIADDMSFRFIVTAADDGNQTLVINTQEVTVKAADPSNALTLSVNAEFDKTEIGVDDQTANVLVTVTNTGGWPAKNVRVRHGETTLYTFTEIPVNESRSFTREVQLSQPGKFQFSATARNIFEVDEPFYSNEIIVTMAAPTPEPEQGPQRTMPSLVTEPIPTQAEFSAGLLSVQKILSAVFYVLAVIILLCILLILASLIKRSQNKKKSEGALDHLQRYIRRDYTAPKEDGSEEMAPVNPDMMDETEDLMKEDIRGQEDPMEEVLKGQPTVDSVVSNTGEKTVMPHEKYLEASSPSADALQDETSEPLNDFDQGVDMISGGTGRYRLTRPEETPEPPADQAAQAEEKPRRRRSSKS